MSPPPRQNPLDEMSRSGESSRRNLYIVNDPISLGGPFGIFAASCEATLLEGFSKKVAEDLEILAEFPGRGDLLKTLHQRLKFYAIGKGLSWFQTTMSDILERVGDLLDDGLHAEQVSHFEAMVE